MSNGITAKLVSEVAREVDARRGARVRSVHQDGPTRFRLDLRSKDERIDFVIDLEAWMPRVHLAAPRPAPEAPAPLAGALRKRLRGARLESCESVAGERALALRFAHEGESSRLCIELFGGQANWYLLDSEGRVDLTPRGDVARRRGAAPGTRFTPSPPRPIDETDPAATVGGSAAVESLWRAARAERRTDSAAARVRKVVKRRHTRAVKAAAALKQAIERESEGERHQRNGELLRASFHLLRPGASSVRVPDYATDPPAEVEIPLDAALSPGEQVAACFRKARRCRRAAEEARRRSSGLAAQLETLADALAALQDIEDEDEVRRIAASLPDAARAEAERALLASTRPKAKGPQRAAPWRTFVSRDGWTILVGRDARGNDELTLHKAAPGDLFLHVRGASGSHVIVPTPRGKTVPKETLLDAAELACHFSERAEATHNEVDHTPRRYVRKPRGSPPGLVLLERGKTLSVRRDPERRRRLLAEKRPEST